VRDAAYACHDWDIFMNKLLIVLAFCCFVSGCTYTASIGSSAYTLRDGLGSNACRRATGWAKCLNA